MIGVWRLPARDVITLDVGRPIKIPNSFGRPIIVLKEHDAAVPAALRAPNVVVNFCSYCGFSSFVCAIRQGHNICVARCGASRTNLHGPPLRRPTLAVPSMATHHCSVPDTDHTITAAKCVSVEREQIKNFQHLMSPPRYAPACVRPPHTYCPPLICTSAPFTYDDISVHST